MKFSQQPGLEEFCLRHADALANAVEAEMRCRDLGNDIFDEVRRALLSVCVREGVVVLSAYSRSKPDRVTEKGLSFDALPSGEREILLEALKRYSFL